jgi:hypothetical protein
VRALKRTRLEKLLNLKEWLSLKELALFVANEFAPSFTEADLLRLALDEKLKLSVLLPPGTLARLVPITPKSDGRPKGTPPGKSVRRVPKTHRAIITDNMKMTSRRPMGTIKGVWDLP